MSIYDFSITTQDGSEVPLSNYKGKVMLIVNTATGCGFTPQYEDLQEIYNDYHERGLEILDFPCNQFGDQAPGTNEDIHTYCIGRFAISFPQFAKIDVNGENAIPLYKWLCENTSFNGFGMSAMGLAMSAMLAKQDKNYKNTGSIKWNFTKFLVDRDGNIVARFEPTASLKKVRARIETLL